MNFSEMATLVRTQADADTDDAPDTLLTMYARAAYNDIRRRIYPWPDKFVTYTFTTVADQAAYPFTGFSVTDLEYIKSVSGPTEKQIFVPFTVYVELLEGSDIDHSTREADYFTADFENIYLWPTPNETGVSYTVYGYRAFADWPSGSDEPDLPRVFDESIVWYMLSKYYMAQEDLELAQLYMQEYEMSVNRHIAGATRTSVATQRPLVFGGDSWMRPVSYADWVRRMTEGI